MKWRNKIILACLAVLFCSSSFGQMGQYGYKRELETAHEQWQRIVLPNEIFGKLAADLSDIRIFGITKNNDTLTAPFILQEATGKISGSEVDFRLINQSGNAKGYFFTFELPANKTINQVRLDFKQSNFDWRAKLEGSQDQQVWFTVADNYRVLSIKNELTSYQFTTLAFPDASYRYFRLVINSGIKPGLLTAKISKQDTVEGKFITFSIHKTTITEIKPERQTAIDIDLPLPVPVSYLKIFVHDKIDYYRPVTIKYPADSFNTEKGWMYDYSTLTSGTLNSIEKNELKFNSTILKKLEIVIDNQDNQPLRIDSFEVKGYEHSLMTRFTEPASWWLVYGNSKASKPHYDIDRFSDKIPAAVTSLQLGTEQIIPKETSSATRPLFQNKIWLWLIMAVIIVILGGFSLRMMRKAG